MRMELFAQYLAVNEKLYQRLEPLAPLAGGMAVLPVVPDELPMELEPVLPDVPGEPVEPVEGLVEEDPGVVVPVLSAALLQPASANAATSASAAAVPVFSVCACMSVFL